MRTDQGGYYGIKGYIYQYNSALNELLHIAEKDDYIELEQLEDLSDKNRLVQIKYKEKGNFNPSSIREPIKNLLNIMSIDSRDLYLHCYFPNLKSKKIDNKTIRIDTEITISEKYLNTILGKEAENYTKEDKEKFVSKFRIKFTNEYEKEFGRIISKISNNYHCDEDIALIHYSNMITFLLDKVTNNSSESTGKRKCYKEEIDDLVNHSKSVFVRGYIKEIIGKEKYYTLIRKRLRFNGAPDIFEKIFIFDDSDSINVNFYVKLIRSISEKFLKVTKSGPKKKRKLRVDSGAPYVFINNISKEKLDNIKKWLYKNEVNLIDGYPFHGSDFYVDYLTQETETHSNFKVKVINEKNELFEAINFLDGNLLDLYYFNSQANKELREEINLKLNEFENSFSYISIDSLDDDIFDIFK